MKGPFQFQKVHSFGKRKINLKLFWVFLTIFYIEMAMACSFLSFKPILKKTITLKDTEIQNNTLSLFSNDVFQCVYQQKS